MKIFFSDFFFLKASSAHKHNGFIGIRRKVSAKAFMAACALARPAFLIFEMTKHGKTRIFLMGARNILTIVNPGNQLF